jgi:hypothetical protein
MKRFGPPSRFLARLSPVLVLPAVLLCMLSPRFDAGKPALAATSGAILMFHNDAARTGWTMDEHELTPQAVRAGGLQKLWAAALEGEIYAEPLVVPGVQIGETVRTVVYAVTEHDLIYAVDAGDGHRLWGPVSLGVPVPRGALQCGNIDPVGITSTPVADPDSSTLYVSGLTTPDGGRTKVYKVAALDLATGHPRPGWPVNVAPPASSGHQFDPGIQQQRSALALVRGVVYIAFGGYWGDCGDYHGWVVGVSTASPDHQQSFATPTHRMGGIWAAGGVAADPEGNLYASSGNSDSQGTVDLSESVIRLRTAPALGFSGAPRDFFVPSNFVTLNEHDTDLGSASPLVLPDQPETSTPHLLFIAGKQGVGYLIDRDNMGGLSKGDGITGEGLYSRCLFGDCQSGPPKVFSDVAYWDGRDAGRFIIVPGRGSQPAPCHGTGGVVALRLGSGGAAHGAVFDIAWCSGSMRNAGAPASRLGGGCRPWRAVCARCPDGTGCVHLVRRQCARRGAPVHHSGRRRRTRLRRRGS